MNTLQTTSEERMLAIASCVTAHVGFGIVPLIIFAFKRKDSNYVAYYAAIGAMTGGIFLASIVLFFVGSILGVVAATAGGAVSLIGTVLMLLSWPVLLFAFPIMVVIMIMSAIAAGHNRLVELPILSKCARKFAGI